MRLYELAPQYAAIAAAALDDNTPEMEAALAAVTDDLSRKVDGLVHVIADLDAEALTLRAEEARLADRRRLREQRVERLRDYLREQMDAHGITKIATATSTITVSDGPQRVVVEDEGAVPAEYIRTKKEIDKRAILDAMKSNGECVPGTRVERSRALRIK
jgi:phage host-nuclease inhibitor protein Gam